MREPNTNKLNCGFCVYNYVMCSSTYKELNNLVTCTRYIYLYCMPRMRISINFEQIMHITVSVARAFGTTGHVQQSVRTAKRTLKEFEEVSEVLKKISLKQRYGRFSRQPCISLLH